MNARVIFKGLGLILSLALLGYVFESSGLSDSVNEAWIDAHVRGHGLSGEMLFLLMGGIFTALGLPRQVIAFLGGYAFNVWLGTLLGTLAALLGCALSFAYARFFGRELLRARLGKRAHRFDRFIHHHPVSMTVLIRLLPVGSNILTNLAAGISSIRLRHFLLGSMIGYVPQTLIFALVGSGVHLDPVLKIGLAVALFLVSAVLGLYLYRRNRVAARLGESIGA
ncbi:MAG: VTT domain-containing protein [Thiobacillus sp.]|nr:VTT domain-containing protein [Thiobacillus sp.]